MSRTVYFAECGGKIKVGIASNVKTRLSQLRTGAAQPVTLIASVAGDSDLERALHKRLKRHHIDGEWFKDCPEVRAIIQNAVNNFDAAPEGVEKSRKNDRFAVVCKALWPIKTAAHIASIAGKDERTGSRWLSGEFEPPGVVLAAIVFEITRRD